MKSGGNLTRESNMNYDEYGEVINGEETYKGIAEELRTNAVIIGWTDEQMSHFDILFTFTAISFGSQIQGGVKPRSDLFVSVMRKGSFAFDISNEGTHWGYYDEKLHGGFGEITGQKVADLINGVKRYL